MDVFRYFSSPMEGDYRSLAAELVTLQYIAFCQQVRDRIGCHRYENLIEVMLERIRSREASSAYWTPEVSSIFAGLHPAVRPSCRSADNDWLLAQVVISGLITGILDEVAIDVELQSPVLICGRSIEGQCKLHADNKSISLTRKDGRGLQLHCIGDSDRGPLWDHVERPSNFIKIDGQSAIRLVGDSWHRMEWINDRCDVETDFVSAAEQLQSALQLLREVSPKYVGWVCALLSEITPIVRPAANMISSNSSALRMGGIDVAVPASVTETAEMLVHECSHQYYHMCGWLGSTVIPGARSYYSPLKKCDRPLDRILLGYHAFGNAMIVFDYMATAGLNQEVRARWSTVACYMRELAAPLQDHAELSELGIALYEPLRDRLKSLRFSSLTEVSDQFAAGLS
ncbi:HEXXH motif-containing putative peptide modification protein [Xanthomonas sp. 4461]|uniref:aKG-HExxH-type peptide beta-hydroxylase n=1 Tax=Xanthomonas sp. 4461 TaxID=3035313 RepID=UPI002167AAC2|nr:HEXXH motif-containing putative peptide modification protein [Xanthomonas sp. 4461]MCS3809275.1 HEXXH motif-containing protein [Xanthomonas sp. 4461]